MTTRLVRIDVETKTYSVFLGRELVNSIQCADYLDAEFVEYFRTNTAEVMRMVDE